ncbi:MAG: hypothetical protein D6689_03105 [Deltaproteobacteria bacterium]|nr:MAG: hypothetical protein D6689_03105 [Deltaproteobacteria bacterium]
MGPGDTVPLIYVDREDTHVASPLEFDTYQPGSDIMRVDLTLGPDGAIVGVGTPRSILGSCPGTRSVRDASAPAVNVDGRTVAFSMRLAEGEPRDIYVVDIDGNGCRRVHPDGFPDEVDGIKVHNFDPVWSPDGEWIVFASSRAGTVSRKLFLPQSDIWRMRADGTEPEQMTVLTNSEIQPGIMRLGRITMSTEKVSDGFYQVSGRRLNWDRTDYHPLLAQRAMSPFCDPNDLSVECPSIGYHQATEITEGANGDFLVILSDPGARGGGGTLGIFNRSVGPFEMGRNDPGYAKSLTIVDPAATGRVGSPTEGVYRSPISLPDTGILVAYAAYTGDLGAATALDYDLVATRPCVPPAPGATCVPERTVIVGGPGQQIEPVLAIKRPAHAGYENRRQLVFGGGIRPEITGGTENAVAYVIDAPLIFTLLVANLRRGRPVDAFRTARYLAAYVEQPAPAGTTAPTDGKDHYENRIYAGRVPLFEDGSTKIRAPAFTPLVLALEDADGNTVIQMRETHQFGPGETISMGVVEPVFDGVCAGCHGSISGRELDVITSPDVLTGASQSLALDAEPMAPSR